MGTQKNNKIDYRLMREMKVDENILWAGRSKYSRYSHKVPDGEKDTGLFSIVVTVLITWLAYSQYETGVWIILISLVTLIISYFSILIFLTQLHFLRTLYVVTTHRFFEFNSGSGVLVNCFYGKDIIRVIFSKNSGPNLDDIIVVGSNLDETGTRVFMSGIEDAETVVELIQDLISSKAQE